MNVNLFYVDFLDRKMFFNKWLTNLMILEDC